MPQPVEIDVKNKDLRAHSDRHLGSVDSNRATANDDDPRRTNPRDAAEQYTTSAKSFLEEVAAYDRRHSSCNFAHRSE